MRRPVGSAVPLLVALALVLMPVSPAAAEEVAAEPAAALAPTPESTAAESEVPAPVESTPTPEPSDPAPTTPAPTTPTPEPQPEPEAEPGRFALDDAELRWGVNHESNNRAFAPGTFNFFSAGKIADPGRGAAILPESGWSARKGDVTIEKQVGTTYQRATWAGLRTDSAGVAIPSATSGRFSNHQVVIGGGTGEIDTAARTATIRWDADFTVVYYSGYSFFYVSDPVLTVKDGKGTVKATLSGFASSMEDLGKWEAVPARTVTLATLPKVAITADGRGFTADVAYAGVRVSGVDQVTSGPNVGSFPQSFVDFQEVAGAAAYWYSSGGSTDAYKAALPMTVSYDRGSPIAPPVTATPTGSTDTVSNPVVSPPPISTFAGGAPTALGVPVGAAAPVSAVPVGVATTTDAAFTQAGTSTLTADEIAARTAAAVWWWLGAVLLTLAAGSVAGTVAYSSFSHPRAVPTPERTTPS